MLEDDPTPVLQIWLGPSSADRSILLESQKCSEYFDRGERKRPVVTGCLSRTVCFVSPRHPLSILSEITQEDE